MNVIQPLGIILANYDIHHITRLVRDDIFVENFTHLNRAVGTEHIIVNPHSTTKV